MTSGNGLSIAYTASNKAKTITRGTASVSFDHDPEHQRYAQTSLSGVTLYLAGGGVLAERFAGSGGTVRWTNYLMVGGRYIGIHVENSDETTTTRYFHTDHLGSIAVITNEVGVVVERLSYDAWGLRRHPDGTPDPSGSIASQSSRGFTGHEHLEAVGLIHMNGRVYDPLLARFGTPDPMTEDPFSTQGWNRYSYVGNSPLNFTDPSGYCFLGCFWKPIFKAIGNFFKQAWRALVQLAATALICGPGTPICAGVVAFAVTGVTSGDLGLAMRAGITAFATAFAFKAVGDITGHTPDFGTSEHLQNIAGHALVGCVSAVAQGSKCGSGALSGAVGSFVSPLLRDQSFGFRLVATSVLGGAASVAAGGNFGHGALTAAFGYLFNEVALMCRSAISMQVPFAHCGLFVFERQNPDSNDLSTAVIKGQFSLAGGDMRFRTDTQVYSDDLAYFRGGGAIYTSSPPQGMSPAEYDAAIIALAERYEARLYDPVFGPNSNSAAAAPIIQLGGSLPAIPTAPALTYYQYKWNPWWNPFK